MNNKIDTHKIVLTQPSGKKITIEFRKTLKTDDDIGHRLYDRLLEKVNKAINDTIQESQLLDNSYGPDDVIYHDPAVTITIGLECKGKQTCKNISA